MRKEVNSSVIIFLNCKIRFVYTWYRFPIHLNLWNKIFAIKKRYNKSDTALLIWYTGIWFIKINMQLSNQIVLMFVWWIQNTMNEILVSVQNNIAYLPSLCCTRRHIGQGLGISILLCSFLSFLFLPR